MKTFQFKKIDKRKMTIEQNNPKKKKQSKE